MPQEIIEQEESIEKHIDREDNAQKEAIASAVLDERERIVKDCLNLYKKKYSHPTREYSQTDEFRDDILKLIQQPK